MQSSPRRIALYVLAIAGCAVGAFALWRFFDRGTAAPELDTGAAITRLYEENPSPKEPGSETGPVDAPALANAIVDSCQEIGIPDAAELSSAVQRTVDAYALEEINDYIDWQVAEGITPVPKWQSDPERFESAWDTLRATFVFADIDESRVRVIWRSRDAVRSGEAGVQIKSKTRAEGRPFLEGLSVEPEVCEVLLPGRFPTLDGDFAETEMGIEMTKRPDTGAWVITGIHHYADQYPAPRIAIPPL
jgi:hypothetical protein